MENLDLEGKVNALTMELDETSELLIEAYMALSGIAGTAMFVCDGYGCPGHLSKKATDLLKLGIKKYIELSEEVLSQENGDKVN